MDNKMVNNIQNKCQKKCFMKKVGVIENNVDEEGYVLYEDVQMLFESKQDYNKIRLIDKMFKKYFVLEKKYFNTRKYLLKEYLKEMIMKLEEQHEIFVMSEQGQLYKDEFKYIGRFLSNGTKFKLPSSPSSLIILDKGVEEDIKEDEIKNKKYHRYIRKVVKLLEEKFNFK